MSSYKLERDALHELLTYNLDDVGDIVLALAEAQKRCDSMTLRTISACHGPLCTSKSAMDNLVVVCTLCPNLSDTTCDELCAAGVAH